MKDIDEMAPGPHLNALIAQIVGWQVLGVNARFCYGVRPNSEARGVIPRYCDHIDSAYEMQEVVLQTEARGYYIKYLSAAVLPKSGKEHGREHLIALAHASPLDRCKAALKAMRKLAEKAEGDVTGKKKKRGKDKKAARK